MDARTDQNLNLDLLEFTKRYDHKIPMIESIKGFSLEKRYLIQEKLAEGAYGIIYKGFDLLSPMI